MYERFFGLREAAFALTPDPRFLWLSETHEEGLSVLEYGIQAQRGFVLLTGEVGTGKTTLLRAVLHRLGDHTDIALVLNTAGLEPLDLLRVITAEFQIRGSLKTKADCVIALNGFLLAHLRSGKNCVLIVDEAQNLDERCLEEVRLLSNLETDSSKLLQIVLTGQPELRKKIAVPALRPLRERIAIEHHVMPLEPEEVERYLRHRIEVAGGRFEEVFEEGVASVFHAFSAGRPRMLNLLADRTLLAAFSREVRPVPASLVERKAKELARFVLDPDGSE